MTVCDAPTRRECILQVLQDSMDAPVTAAVLAQKFSVSRQVIVGDIALLRSAGVQIDATPRGYVLHRESAVQRGVIRTYVCIHSAVGMLDELNLMVDFGCTVCDVSVEHPVYGVLTGQLQLSSRYDVSVFADKIASSDALPLSALTEGVHTHTVLCPTDAIGDLLSAALEERGYLVR